jgi:hypothetical protein
MRFAPLSHRTRQILTLILLGIGLAHWFHFYDLNSLDSAQRTGIVVAFILAFIPSFSRGIRRLAQGTNAALQPRPRAAALAVALLVMIYLLLLATASTERLFIKVNDEHAYMIQARMLAHGHLWHSPYPPNLVPFFDALGLIGDRVYAAMYFPGTALATVPFIWLGLPFWLMPLTAASIAAGLLYILVAELFDPVRALLAIFILLSLKVFRENSALLLAEMPFLVAELVMFLAWFRLRRRLCFGGGCVLGVAAGYAAITRPLDAVCFSLPIGVAIAVQLWRQPQTILKMFAAVVLGASPCLILLLVQNIGVTGHWNELAETYYNRENFPASPMGFHQVVPADYPPDISTPKRQWLHDWVIPAFQKHTPAAAIQTWYRGRLKQILEAALTNPAIGILLPLSLLSLSEPRRWILFAALALFLGGYAIYLFLLDHYVIAILPSVICLILMGWQSLQRAWPASRFIGTFIPMFILLVCVSEIWPFDPIIPLSPTYGPDQRAFNRELPKLSKVPAVVLFRFDPMVGTAHDDPVYNNDVEWPDDEWVVRARDLGPEKDMELFRYYAQRQPSRVFYIYDPDARANHEKPLSGPIGTAAELAK